MSKFFKYQHVANKFNGVEVNGLLNGELIIQPKLDGSNCQMYKQDNELRITSRNNILSLDNDNASCYKTLITQNKYKKFFEEYPNIKLCGEWLVKHHINYIEDSYNEFYVFDAIDMATENDHGQCDYLSYVELTILLDSYSIKYVPWLKLDAEDFKSKINIFFQENIEFCNFLIDAEGPRGEGIIVKNYDYKNKFGRSTWCKLINENAYKNKGRKIKSSRIIDKNKEESFVNNHISDHLFNKCYYKLATDGILENEFIGEYVKLCQSDFIDDFMTLEDRLLFNIKIIKNIISVRAVKFWRDK